MSRIGQIGRSIRYYREKMGITQRALAEGVLVSFQAISAWERGMSVPDLENAVRIADFFGIPVDALLSQSEKPLYVGIDGGGTKTEFVLFEANGTVHDVVFLEGSNPNDRGIERSIAVLTEGLEKLLRGKTASGVFAGIGGVSLPAYQKAITEQLTETFHTKVVADTDAANVLSMGADPENSMAVICGTGSCVFVRKGKERYRLGGWGYLLDQAGSAYDVGKDALRLTLAVEDGLEKPCLLADNIKELLGGNVFANIGQIYQKGRPYIADLARLVLQSADAGDSRALEILQNNAARLGMLIRTGAQRYGQPAQVVGAGSFLKSQLFRDMVQQQAGLELHMPELPPAYGACVEALRMADVALEENFYKKFADSYGRVLCLVRK